MAKGTPLDGRADILDMGDNLSVTKRNKLPRQLANMFRTLALHRHGGVWVDTDTIILREDPVTTVWKQRPACDPCFALQRSHSACTWVRESRPSFSCHFFIDAAMAIITVFKPICGITYSKTHSDTRCR